MVSGGSFASSAKGPWDAAKLCKRPVGIHLTGFGEGP